MGARRAFAALLDLDEEAFDTKFAGNMKQLCSFEREKTSVIAYSRHV